MMGRGLLTHFVLNRPRDHWREVSCLEIGCVNYAMGWKTILPADDIANIELIRRLGMGFREECEDGLVVFVFTAGQECFAGRGGGHKVAVGRDPILTRDNKILEPLEWIDNWNDHFYRRSINNG